MSDNIVLTVAVVTAIKMMTCRGIERQAKHLIRTTVICSSIADSLRYGEHSKPNRPFVHITVSCWLLSAMFRTILTLRPLPFPRPLTDEAATLANSAAGTHLVADFSD